jgi:hypothetical protein
MDYEALYRLICLAGGIYALFRIIQTMIIKFNAPDPVTNEYHESLGYTFVHFLIGVGIMLLGLLVQSIHMRFWPWM